MCDIPGSNPYKLKAPHSEVFVEMHWGRLLVYLPTFCRATRFDRGRMGTGISLSHSQS